LTCVTVFVSTSLNQIKKKTSSLFSEPTNNGNHGEISESAEVDGGEDSDSPAPPSAAANGSSAEDGNSQPSNNNMARVPTTCVTSLPQQDVPSCDNEQVHELFLEEFSVGKWYHSSEALCKAGVDFGNRHYFTMRREEHEPSSVRGHLIVTQGEKGCKGKDSGNKRVCCSIMLPSWGRFSVKRKDNGKAMSHKSLCQKVFFLLKKRIQQQREYRAAKAMEHTANVEE
jgi:hypothetical protein